MAYRSIWTAWVGVPHTVTRFGIGGRILRIGVGAALRPGPPVVEGVAERAGVTLPALAGPRRTILRAGRGRRRVGGGQVGDRRIDQHPLGPGPRALAQASGHQSRRARPSAPSRPAVRPCPRLFSKVSVPLQAGFRRGDEPAGLTARTGAPPCLSRTSRPPAFPPGGQRIHARSPSILSALEAMADELGTGYRRAEPVPARGHRRLPAPPGDRRGQGASSPSPAIWSGSGSAPARSASWPPTTRPRWRR